MEMLNSVSTILSGNLWVNLINLFAKWVVNYGWAIILFTIALKLVLSPLDIFQRIASGKQQRVMNAMQPQLQALQQKYANNKEKLNEETNKLYKKYNTGLGGMCIIMLVTMVLNIVIVFTLYNTVRTFGDENMYSSFYELDQTYQTAYDVKKDEGDEAAQTYAIEVTQEKYDELKKQNSWLWVKNVWKGDINTSQFVEFEDYANHYNLSAEKIEDNADWVRYQIITQNVGGGNAANGYYVLIILAAAVSFLTQFISMKLLQPKGQKMGTMNKVMMAIIPITMVILASTSNVIYTLYVIVNSLVTAIISTIISLIMNKINKKYEGNEELLLKKKKVQVVEYSRNFRKKQ